MSKAKDFYPLQKKKSIGKSQSIKYGKKLLGSKKKSAPDL